MWTSLPRNNNSFWGCYPKYYLLLFLFFPLIISGALFCTWCIAIGRLYNLVAKIIWLLSPPSEMFNDDLRMLEKTSVHVIVMKYIYIHVHVCIIYVCVCICMYKCGKHSLIGRILTVHVTSLCLAYLKHSHMT